MREVIEEQEAILTCLLSQISQLSTLAQMYEYLPYERLTEDQKTQTIEASKTLIWKYEKLSRQSDLVSKMIHFDIGDNAYNVRYHAQVRQVEFLERLTASSFQEESEFVDVKDLAKTRNEVLNRATARLKENTVRLEAARVLLRKLDDERWALFRRNYNVNF